MVFNSAEIRWFIKGNIPPEVSLWFHSIAKGVIVQPARSDLYLALPDSETLGIKMREGKLEFKQAGGGKNKKWEHDKVSGEIEFWQKWSFLLNDLNAPDNILEAYPDSWISVHKERMLHIYKPSASGKPEPGEQGAFYENGCGVELTQLHLPVKNEAWWTFGFEAFGQLEQMHATLLQVVEHILSVPGYPVMKIEDSCSYPAWLIGCL